MTFFNRFNANAFLASNTYLASNSYFAFFDNFNQSFKWVGLMIVLAIHSTAYAGLFQIVQRNYGSVPEQFQSSLDTVFNQLETQVNSNLPSSTAGGYLKGVANSTAIATSGLGIDYATQYKWFDLGYTVGVGADLGGQSFSTNMDANRVGGFSAAQTFVLGIPLSIFGSGGNGGSGGSGGKFFNYRQLKLNFSYSAQKYSQTGFQSTFTTYGLMTQYKILPTRSWAYRSLEWGGVDVSMGYLSTQLSALSTTSVSETLSPTTVDLGIPTQVTGSFSGNMEIGYEANISKIPVEISSSFRMLYIFNLYMGLGYDFVTGTSQSITNYSGPVTLSTNPSSGTVSGTAILDMGEKNSPNSTMSRYFVGAQLELGIASLFAQYNKALQPDVVGFNLGARIFW